MLVLWHARNEHRVYDAVLQYLREVQGKSRVGVDLLAVVILVKSFSMTKGPPSSAWSWWWRPQLAAYVGQTRSPG
jgi:hypothetical protein